MFYNTNKDDHYTPEDVQYWLIPSVENQTAAAYLWQEDINYIKLVDFTFEFEIIFIQFQSVTVVK